MANKVGFGETGSGVRKGSRVSPPAKRPRASINLANAKLIDGDVVGARATFEQLRAAQRTNPDLPLMEAKLLEAEGRIEEALACLGHIVAFAAGSTGTVAQACGRMARLAVKLGREDAAETSGMAALALDPDDIDGLRALAFAERRHAAPEARLPILRRLANAAGAEGDVWFAIEAFADIGHWNEALELIERHEFELDPWRMAPWRIRALVELGWHRRALEQICKAYADEYIRGFEAVELLIRCGALALAAGFVDGCLSSDPWQAEARTSLIDTASRTCAAASVQQAPLQFADAIQACGILSPRSETIEAAIADTIAILKMNAEALLAGDDPTGATQMLVAALRLAPMNRTLLDSLAEASRRACLTERYVDTLLRIWTASRDASVVQKAVHAVLATQSWGMTCRVMAVAAPWARSSGLDIDPLVEWLREQASRKVDGYLRAGDVTAGLELVIELSGRWSIAGWADGLISRLLKATKRRLRSRRFGGEALIATVGPLYLELAPRDVDVCRMLARALLRQGRLGDARELFSRMVAINPHVARDWVGLAMVQHELGECEARDFSIARAMLITPDVDLPPILATDRERLGLL